MTSHLLYATSNGKPMDPRRKVRSSAALWTAVGLAAAAVLVLATTPRPASPARIEIRPPAEIEFRARVNSRPFDGGWSMPGYHAIVWKGGSSAHAALLQADVTDVQILDALESLHAHPGNNLSMDAWEERKNPKNPAPDTVIAGPPVDILLRLPGRGELVPLSAVLEDSGGRGLEMRLGGNRANIPKWKSGCIVCLYSCPGSKMGNARYTERDYARGATRFRLRKGSLPGDGTEIGVVLRLGNAKPPA